MATTEQLGVKINADVAGAVNGIKQVNNELNKMPATAGKAGAATGKLGKDFTGLSRVVQDLPFGFVAISNNLTQLIPAAGGAGLAFSVLIAALSFAQTGLDNWTRGLSGSKKTIEENSVALIAMSKEIEDAKDRMDAFASTLDFVNKIGKLRLDIDFGKGLSTDLLDLQGISVGNRELGQRLRETRDIILKHKQKADELFTKSLTPKQFDDVQKGGLDVESLDEDQKKLHDALQKANDEFIRADDELIKNRQEQTIIHAQIEQQKIDIIEENAKKEEDARKKRLAAQKKQLKEEEDALEAHLIRLKSLTASTDEMRAMLEQLRGGKDVSLFFNVQLAKVQAKNNPSETIGQKLTKELLPKTIPLRVNVAPSVVIDKPPDLTELQKALQDAVQNLGVDVFSGIGDALAAGLTGGNIGDAFKTLFSFVGNALQDFGKQVIAFSSIMVALKKAIASFNPAASLVAGIALVAIGGVLKNLKPKGFATGGVIPAGFPNDSYYARLTSGERVLTPAQNKEWERGAMGRANMAFPEYLPAVSISANQLDLFYKRSNRFVTNTH